MKESLWGYLILLLGVIVTTVMLLVSRVTTHAEEDYYLAREIMQASMLDAVDYGAYRTTSGGIYSYGRAWQRGQRAGGVWLYCGNDGPLCNT